MYIVRVEAAMQHAQVLYKIPSVPAKMEFNVLRYEHYDGTFLGTGTEGL